MTSFVLQHGHREQRPHAAKFQRCDALRVALGIARSAVISSICTACFVCTSVARRVFGPG